MKKKIAFVIALMFGVYWIYQIIMDRKKEKEHQARIELLEHTASKNVHVLTDEINVDYLNEKRTLGVYLPENYEKDSINYSVIYFLDGQSLFDQKIHGSAEWGVDEVLDSLGKIQAEQSIIIGIYNSKRRMKEYKPFPSDRWYSDWTVSGDKHADWIVKKLKPYIDSKYRTKKEAASTIIGGASLGGLMSYYMLMEYPTTFGGAIVFSPSFWVNEKVYELHKNNAHLNHQKIYFDAGQLETPTVESIQKMEKLLVEHGMPKENIRLDIEEGLGHWHMTWIKGFRKAYPWIVQEN